MLLAHLTEAVQAVTMQGYRSSCMAGLPAGRRKPASSLTSEVRECEGVRTQLTLSGGRAGGEGFKQLCHT